MRQTTPTKTGTWLLRLSLVLLIWGLLTRCASPIPSDKLLIERFTVNQDSFETLVALMAEDTDQIAIYKITKDYVQYYAGREGELAEQRIQEYRHLLDALGLLSITHYPDEEGEKFLLTVLAQGWSPEGGIYKGYEYFPDGLPEKNEDQLVASLEYDPAEHDSGTWLYRHIEENWYLWFLY